VCSADFYEMHTTRLPQPATGRAERKVVVGVVVVVVVAEIGSCGC
jgi:hypothetical protein